MSLEPIVDPIHEPTTGTWQYIISDPETRYAVIVDPVLDFDAASTSIKTSTADRILALILENEYQVERILETHIHADHLTAAGYLQAKLTQKQTLRPRICAGMRICQVQQRIAAKYEIPKEDIELAFDHIFQDDEVFNIGYLKATVMHLPGHTPDHIGYRVGRNVFCGDSLFNSDVGSARCDFPGGSSTNLYASARRLFELPEDYKIWTGHDYPPKDTGRDCPVPYETVGHQRRNNKHLNDSVQINDFVAWRSERDAGLSEPRLIHQALQWNTRGGRMAWGSHGSSLLMRVPVKLPSGNW